MERPISYCRRMQTYLLAELRAREKDIHQRWLKLLRVEPVLTPLGHPDTLAHLIDWTVAEVFRDLAAGAHRRHAELGHVGAPYRSLCVCGRNPLLAYFDAASQVLREALILTQASIACLDPVERDASLEELNLVLDHVSRREIEAFCGVCQHGAKRHDSHEYASCAAPAN